MSLHYQPKEVVHTFEELEAVCHEWQERLRLQDWTIRLRLYRRSGMCYANSAGEVDWLKTKKSAVICILERIDYDPSAVYPLDHELALVHELLHLHFAAFRINDDSAEDVAQEIAIEQIAQALVQMKREKHDA